MWILKKLRLGCIIKGLLKDVFIGWPRYKGNMSCTWIGIVGARLMLFKEMEKHIDMHICTYLLMHISYIESIANDMLKK